LLAFLACSPNMSTSEHYKSLANECRQNAKEADDADERDTLLRIAALWDRLAERKALSEGEKQ
jgi:hypothetical protein